MNRAQQKRRGRPRMANPCARFANVDWTKRDVDIAREMGCSRERVRKVRLTLNKPRSAVHGLATQTLAAMEWLKRSASEVQGFTVDEIADAAPVKVCYGTWSRLAKELGIKLFRVPMDDVRSREDLKGLTILTDRGCWEWRGYRHPVTGYGQFCGEYAHRFSYQKFVGDIPVGLLVMHKCDNPPCCNPDHLLVGTDQDNIDDAIAKGRRGKTRAPLETVAVIRAMTAAGRRDYYSIGKELGLSGATVWKIAKGKTYKQTA